MASTQISAAETTQNVSSSQHVRDVAPRLRYLNPEAAPFTLILDAESSKPAKSYKVEWAEKGSDFNNAGFAPKWANINGGNVTAGATTLTVDDGAGNGTGYYFKPNDTVKVLRTGELMNVTAPASATTITVTRGLGLVAGTALLDNDDLVIVGTAYQENANVATPQSFQEIWKFNYTQIFRNAVGASRTQTQVENYLGDERTRRRMEAGIEHRIDIERAFLYGERNLRTATPPTGAATSSPYHSTGGFFYWANANIVNAAGTLTEPEVWNFCQNVFQHTAGGDSRTLFASPLHCSVFDLIAGARMMTAPKEDTYGLAIKQWVTSHGTLNIVKHRLLETGFNSNIAVTSSTGGTGTTTTTTATTGYGGFAIAVNIPSLTYRPLQTTQLLVDRQGPGVDGYIDEYLTECGLQMELPALHGWIHSTTG